MKKRVLIFSIATFLLCSCTNTKSELTELQKQTIKDEVKVEFDKLVSSINDLNFESWADCYSKENFISSLKLSHEGNKDYDEWMDIVKTSFAERSKHTHQLIDLQITPLKSDLALVTQYGILENWWKDGTYKKANGAVSYLYSKENGSWKIIHINEDGNVIEEKISEIDTL